MESFAEIFENDKEQCNPETGGLISGTIVEVRKSIAIVNVGLKSEAIVPLEQFADERGEVNIQPNDRVEFLLDAVEDGNGKTRLSREKAKWLEIWKKLEEIHSNNTTIKGFVKDKVKGGFLVDVFGMVGFLPGSLVSTPSSRTIPQIENTEMEFKIIKLDKNRSNIVLSHRAILEDKDNPERDKLLKSLKKGTIVKGKVKTITHYGAFLSLGGIDGLLHVCDMVWGHVNDPSEIVSVGDEIDVVVLEYEEEKNRVSLGLKQLGDDPWDNIESRYSKGMCVNGKVINITDYGCFVELESGVEGLVHMSEIDWVEKNINPNKAVSVGQEVEVMVLEIGQERRRISLSIKQCLPNPWQEFIESHNKGDVVEGVIKAITDFGIFVRAKNFGIDGLVRLSDISWTEPGDIAVRNYEKGMEIKTMVLDMDVERERISLGIKQLSDDPISSFMETHPKGSLVMATVAEIHNNAAILSLNDSDTLKGRLPQSELPQGVKLPSIGEEVEVKLLEYDKKAGCLVLSMKDLNVGDAGTIDEYRGDSEATVTLGDLVSDKSKTK